MADQGLWFKLWCAAVDDPDLDNLEIGDFGRYCKVGAFTKKHGKDGDLVIAPPARSLCAALQVPDFDALIVALERLPNVSVRRDSPSVSSETNVTVSFKNWQKYQGDYSTQRVRDFRARETRKRRGEETRRDETRGEDKKQKRSRAVLADDAFIAELTRNPAYKHIDLDLELGRMDAWLSTPKAKGRTKTRGFIVNWLNKIDRPVQTEPRDHRSGDPAGGRPAFKPVIYDFGPTQAERAAREAAGA